MTTFYLIRHGEPDWNLAAGGGLKGAEVGWAAHIVPLARNGHSPDQESITIPLEPEDYQLVISSAMTRALQSADIIGGILKLDLRVEFDLHEWVCGWRDSLELVGDTVAEMLAHDGEWPLRRDERLGAIIQRSRTRVSRVLDRYRKFRAGHVVVCHETVIFSLTEKWLRHAESVTLKR